MNAPKENLLTVAIARTFIVSIDREQKASATLAQAKLDREEARKGIADVIRSARVSKLDWKKDCLPVFQEALSLEREGKEYKALDARAKNRIKQPLMVLSLAFEHGRKLTET